MWCIYKGALWTYRDKDELFRCLAIPVIKMVANICRVHRVQFLHKHVYGQHIGA